MKDMNNTGERILGCKIGWRNEKREVCVINNEGDKLRCKEGRER